MHGGPVLVALHWVTTGLKQPAQPSNNIRKWFVAVCPTGPDTSLSLPTIH